MALESLAIGLCFTNNNLWNVEYEVLEGTSNEIYEGRLLFACSNMNMYQRQHFNKIQTYIDSLVG